MFREEYRKANDAIHAPEALKNAIRSKLEQEEAPLFEARPQKQRLWPRIVGYSGVAVATAALVLLIVRPFDLFKSDSMNTTGRSAAGSAAWLEESMITEAAPEEVADEPMLGMSMSVASTEAKGGDDAINDYEPYTVPEPTYDDVWQMLAEASSEPSTEDAPAMTLDEGLTVDNGVLTFGDASVALPEGRTLRAATVSNGFVLVMAEEAGRTYVTVYDNGLNLCGETAADGAFVSFEARDTTLCDDDGKLYSRPALVLTTEWRPNLGAANRDLPGTFCPTVTEAGVTRVLTPEEITLVTVSDRYTVYTATSVDTEVSLLFVFAELGV